MYDETHNLISNYMAGSYSDIFHSLCKLCQNPILDVEQSIYANYINNGLLNTHNHSGKNSISTLRISNFMYQELMK